MELLKRYPKLFQWLFLLGTFFFLCFTIDVPEGYNRSLNGSYGLCNSSWNHVYSDISGASGYVNNNGTVSWNWSQVIFKRFDDIPMTGTCNFPDHPMYMYFFYKDASGEWNPDDPGKGNHVGSMNNLYGNPHMKTWVPFPSESNVVTLHCESLSDGSGNSYQVCDEPSAIAVNTGNDISFKTDTTFIFNHEPVKTWRSGGCSDTPYSTQCGEYNWYASLHITTPSGDNMNSDNNSSALHTYFSAASDNGGLSTNLLSIFKFNSQDTVNSWWMEGLSVEDGTLYDNNISYSLTNDNSYREINTFVNSVTIPFYASTIGLASETIVEADCSNNCYTWHDNNCSIDDSNTDGSLVQIVSGNTDGSLNEITNMFNSFNAL